MRALTLAVVLAFVAPSLPSVVDASPKKARRYEKKGKKAYKKKRWDDAIVAFELAHEAHPKPKYLFNIGRCWEKKGDLFKAMEFIQRYVAEVEEEDEKEDAEEVYSILRGKLLKTSGEVVLDSSPEGASVRLVGEDDQEHSGTTPLTRWLPAGRWKLQIAHDGYEIYEAELFVAVGKSLDRTIELERPKPDEPEVVAGEETKGDDREEVSPPPKKPPKAAGPGWGVWAALGGGAALVGAGCD